MCERVCNISFIVISHRQIYGFVEKWAWKSQPYGMKYMLRMIIKFLLIDFAYLALTPQFKTFTYTNRIVAIIVMMSYTHTPSSCCVHTLYTITERCAVWMNNKRHHSKKLLLSIYSAAAHSFILSLSYSFALVVLNFLFIKTTHMLLNRNLYFNVQKTGKKLFKLLNHCV